MPIESSHDPRTELVRRKYFSSRPQPLEQWIWKQRIAPSAERVFWLHWQEGQRNRDWCSAIALRRVAAVCALDVSSVTRAYQILTKLGLVRRQDPGRDPSRPFEQAVAITEVRVPRQLLTELSHYPDRRDAREPSIRPPAIEAQPSASAEPKPTPAGAATTDPFQALSIRERLRSLAVLVDRLSPIERKQYDEALRSHQPHLTFDEDCRLNGEERAKLLQFLQIAAAKPLPPTQAAATSVTRAASIAVPRKLAMLELARVRRELHALTGMERAAGLLREVVWAVEQGALARFTTLHGTRIALKKIREGQWTRPNRMPPNWSRELAGTELCRSA